MKKGVGLLLNVIGGALCLVGFGICVFSQYAIERLGQHSTWHLERFFSARESDDQRYRDLFNYTRDIVVSRTREVKLAQFALGCSVLINGLLVWKLGRSKLLPKQQGQGVNENS